MGVKRGKRETSTFCRVETSNPQLIGREIINLLSPDIHLHRCVYVWKHYINDSQSENKDRKSQDTALLSVGGAQIMAFGNNAFCDLIESPDYTYENSSIGETIPMKTVVLDESPWNRH